MRDTGANVERLRWTSSTPFLKLALDSFSVTSAGSTRHAAASRAFAPACNILWISLRSLLCVHRISQGPAGLRVDADRFFLIPGRSATTMTSFSCSFTSTRNSPRTAPTTIRIIPKTIGINGTTTEPFGGLIIAMKNPTPMKIKPGVTISNHVLFYLRLSYFPSAITNKKYYIKTIV